MTRLVIGVGVLLVLVLAGVAGAGIYSWVDDEAEAALQESGPLMDETDVINLIETHVKRIGPGPILEWAKCPTEILVDTPNFGAIEVSNTFKATYLGGSTWLVTNRSCTFAVSDKTGEVTGP